MKRPKLPTKIYVRWEDLDDSEKYLSAAADVSEHANQGEVREVGVYSLTQVVKVSAPVVVEK